MLKENSLLQTEEPTTPYQLLRKKDLSLRDVILFQSKFPGVELSFLQHCVIVLVFTKLVWAEDLDLDYEGYLEIQRVASLVMTQHSGRKKRL